MTVNPVFSVQVTPSPEGFLSVRPNAFQAHVYVAGKESVRAFLDRELATTTAVYLLETRRKIIGHQPLVYPGMTGNFARRGTEYKLFAPNSEVDRIFVITTHGDTLTESELKCLEQIMYDAIQASGRAVLANRDRPHGARLRPTERSAVEALARQAEQMLRAVGIDYVDVEAALTPPDLTSNFTSEDDLDTGPQLFFTKAAGVEAVVRRKGRTWTVMPGSTVRAHVVDSASRTPAEAREALLKSGALRRTADPALYRLEVPYTVHSATAAMHFVTGARVQPREWNSVRPDEPRGGSKVNPIVRYLNGVMFTDDLAHTS
jgi:hypothetical protein